MVPIVERMAEAGHSAPSADNSQPWRFIWDGRRITLVHHEHPAADEPFGPASPATLIAMGAAIENMLAAAEFHGAVALPDPEFQADYAAGRYISLQVESDCGAAADDSRRSPALMRHTNRFAYRSDTLPESVLGELRQLAETPARLRILDRREELEEIARLSTDASTLRFQSRQLHESFARCLRFGPAPEEGLDVRTLDLPPGGTLFLRFISDWRRMRALNRVGMARVVAGLETRPLRAGPAVVAVLVSGDRDAGIAAGRLMERTWVRLNAQGIAVHPYYALSDQLQRLQQGSLPAALVPQALELEKRCQAFFGTDTRAQMLLRIGYPLRDPPRSRRRPLASVMLDQSPGPLGEPP